MSGGTTSLFDDMEPPDRPTPERVPTVVRSHVRMTQRDKARTKAKMKRIWPTLQERFKEFHAKNPHVYRRLVEMAKSLKAQGVTKYGIAALYEVLRYEALTTKKPAGEEWKLNNNHKASYARLIETLNPDLKGFFTKRTTKS